MKRFPIQIIAILLLAVSCQKTNAQPEPISAAQQIYKQYADAEGLTVALIGNYVSKGDTINAVMLQAQDSAAWQKLLSDFGQQQVQAAPSGTKVSSLSITHFNNIDTTRIDTISDDINDFFTATAKLQEFISELPAGSVINKIIDTTIVIEHLQSGEKVPEISDIIASIDSTAANRHLMNAVLNGQEKGYIIHTESDEMTLWLFFYSSPDQYKAIMSRINNDWPQARPNIIQRLFSTDIFSTDSKKKH